MRFRLLAAIALLSLVPARAQDAGGPPPIIVNPDPGFDGLSATPRASFNGSSSTVPGLPGSADPYAVLEGMINRILELQAAALENISKATTAAYPADRQVAFRDITTYNGSIEGMLGSSSWADNLAKVRAFENPQTTKNFRYLKIYGPDGHLDIIAKQQKTIRDFLNKQPSQTAVGQPPSPTKGDTPTPATGTSTPPPPITSTSTSTSTGTSTASTTATPTPAVPGEDPIASVQRQIDEISLKIADPSLTNPARQALEIQRNALSQRLAELARQAPGSTDSSARPDGHAPAPASATTSTATGTTSATGTGAGTGAGSAGSRFARGTGPAAPTGAVALMPNSYGVSPMVLSDAEIRAIMDGLIEKELPKENAKLSAKGTEINKYRQIIGSTGKTKIKSVGKPDYDHYREWIKASPTIKQALDQKAAEIYAARAGTAAPAASNTASAPPPAPAALPGSSPRSGGSVSGGETSSNRPADVPLPPGTTLPNGKLDLPSSSAR